jgi:phosphoribosylamine--glycine ligase
MKILVVGNGGREHALVWKIRQSPLVKDVYCAPGNAGMAGLADCVPIDTSNIIEVADFAQTISADLTVVGPELPMSSASGTSSSAVGSRSSAPAAPRRRSKGRRPSPASS